MKFCTGRRNEEVVRTALRLRKGGFPLGEVLPLVLGFNRQHCEPPLSEQEVEKLVEAALRYEARRVVTS